MSHVAQCKAVIKNLEDLDMAAKRLGGMLVKGKAPVTMYGSGFVDDSYQWKEFFSQAEADRISRLPRQQRIDIINAVMRNADHIIKFNKAKYNVGVYKLADNTFRLRYDEWGSGGLLPIMGPGGGLFTQAYGIEAAKRAARMRGYGVKETREKNGTVKLEMMVR